MKKLWSLLFIALLASVTIYAQDAEPTEDTRPRGVLVNTDEAYDGYTLFAPIFGDISYLVDMDGNLIESWEQPNADGHETILYENGNLLYATEVQTSISPVLARAGGGAGGMLLTTWDNEELWSFTYANERVNAHHDMEVLSNGNILMLVWEFYTVDEMLAVGMSPENLPTVQDMLDNGIAEADIPEVGAILWTDSIIEVDPTTNEIVWEWHVWDHLIQDYDESLPNFGDPAEHPERIDINYKGQRFLGDWQHANSIDYNPELDQIALSLRNYSELWIIDHSTTSEEAASSEGGNAGRGGNLLYRWGNPEAYRQGTREDQQLFRQHDVQWIPTGHPGEGNLLVFSNGDSFRDRAFSTVVEIVPPLNDDGTYALTDGVFGPDAPVWEWSATPPEDMFAPFVSGAQRLPNGNTLITEGTEGHLREVNPDGEIVWEYISPYDSARSSGVFTANAVFRAIRYPLDFPAFEGRDLTPEG